ncbi:unnamed protein product [Urochloa humidicola]
MCLGRGDQTGEVVHRRTEEAPARAPAVPAEQTHWPPDALEADALACFSACWCISGLSCVVSSALNVGRRQIPPASPGSGGRGLILGVPCREWKGLGEIGESLLFSLNGS